MESTFKLSAADIQAQILFNDYCVKLMEFKGDKESYPEMNMNNETIPRGVLYYGIKKN